MPVTEQKGLKLFSRVPELHPLTGKLKADHAPSPTEEVGPAGGEPARNAALVLLRGLAGVADTPEMATAAAPDVRRAQQARRLLAASCLRRHQLTTAHGHTGCSARGSERLCHIQMADSVHGLRLASVAAWHGALSCWWLPVGGLSADDCRL